MSCLVVLLGFAVGIFGLASIISMIQNGVATTAPMLFFEVLLIIAFCACLKKYRSPEHQEKMKNSQEQTKKAREEWKAGAPERERKKREAERLRTTIASTRLIGEGSAEYKKSVGNVLVRGAVGGILGGTAGAALGVATAKNKNTNKNVRRFLVKYLDGHIEEKEATIGGSKYKEYMEYLEWDE